MVSKPNNFETIFFERFFTLMVFFNLMIVNFSVYFDNQRFLVAIKIYDKAMNDLLASKMPTLLIGSEFLP